MMLLVALFGCGSIGPFDLHEFLFATPSGCSVARSRRHVHVVSRADLFCAYEGGAISETALSVPPTQLVFERELYAATDAPERASVLLTRVRADRDWMVTLDREKGAEVYHILGEVEMDFIGLSEPTPSDAYVDLEVEGDVAWLLGVDPFTDATTVHRVDLFAYADRPNHPETWLRSVAVDGVGVDLHADQDRAVVLTASGTARTVTVLDASEPDALTVVGAAALEGIQATSVSVYEDWAFLTTAEALWSVDLRSPSVPEVLPTSLPLGHPGVIKHMDWPYVWVAGGTGTPATAYDVSDPEALEELTWFIGGHGVYDVATAGQTVYFATGNPQGSVPAGIQVWAPPRDWDEFEGWSEE